MYIRMNHRPASKVFMTKFEETWKVRSHYIDAKGNPISENDADRVASIVLLQQSSEC